MSEGNSTPEQPAKGLRSFINKAKEIKQQRNRGIKDAVLRAAREQSRNESNEDPLTGLPNRRLFSLELENRVRERTRTNRDFYLVFMDIKDFKNINTVYTHAGGDKMLKLLAKVNESTRPREGLFRVGGDEFVQFIDSNITEEDLVELVKRNQYIYQSEAEKVLSILSPINHHTPLGTSTIQVGIVRYQEGMDTDSLIKLSSEAMLKAKESGSGIVITQDGSHFKHTGNTN